MEFATGNGGAGDIAGVGGCFSSGVIVWQATHWSSISMANTGLMNLRV
jgi:hypothetical protein